MTGDQVTVGPNDCEENSRKRSRYALVKKYPNGTIFYVLVFLFSTHNQKSMFWLDGYKRFLHQALAGWCIVLTMFGSLVVAERSIDLRHGSGAFSSAMPAYEISDTAIESIAHRLTQANTQCKTLASHLALPRDIRTQFSQYGSPAVQKVVPKNPTLIGLGTLLRL